MLVQSTCLLDDLSISAGQIHQHHPCSLLKSLGVPQFSIVFLGFLHMFPIFPWLFPIFPGFSVHFRGPTTIPRGFPPRHRGDLPLPRREHGGRRGAPPGRPVGRDGDGGDGRNQRRRGWHGHGWWKDVKMCGMNIYIYIYISICM